MRWRCAARRSWPVLSRKFATACFLDLFLLFSHVVLMFWHCVLPDAAMASWENFSCVFCFMSLLIVSKLSGVCLFWSVVPFFASRSAVSLPCIPCVKGPTGRQLSCPVWWGVLLFLLLLLMFELWPVCLKLQFVWQIYSPQGRRPFVKPLVWGVVVAVLWLLLLFLCQN